jgi:hypothetical protein
VKKDESEIVLKYNAGTADLVTDRHNIISTNISSTCKKIIFSSKTSLKEKVHALDSLFLEAKINKINKMDSLVFKYGSGNKSAVRTSHTPSI